jgi:hypothetical protein
MSDIKVNGAEWNQLSEENRAQITSIMKENGFLTGTAKIVGDESAPKAAVAVRAAVTFLQKTAKAHKAAAGKGAASSEILGLPSPCKIGCSLFEAAAVAACSLVPPPGNAICVVAAHAGGEFCRSKC